MPHGRPRLFAILVPLWFALALVGTGCSTVDFVPSRSVDFPLAGPLANEIDRLGIRPWFESPPATIDSNVMIFYALEVTDESGTDQWLVRVLPTADLQTGSARTRRGNNEDQTPEERQAVLLGLLRGLTEEYEEHSSRWVEEVHEVDAEYSFGFEEDSAFLPIYADTYGPVRRGTDEFDDEAPGWKRASRPIPVVPVFFHVDLPWTVDQVRRLQELDPETVDPEMRHLTLSSVALSKVKVAQGLIMILGNDTLRSIAYRVVERPSPLAMASTAVRWLTSSRPAMARWLGELSGLRFETLTPDPDLANETGVETIRLRFEPQISTTTLLKTEITAAPTKAAPMLSAGFVSIEGINPYDDTKRFTIRLLGWSPSDAPDERLLSSQAERFRFTPDGSGLVSERGEIWRLPVEPGTRCSQIRPPSSDIGEWSSDGRYYVELGDNGTNVEVIDVADPAAPGRSFAIAKSSALSDVEVSSDGRFVAFIRRKGTDTVAALHELGREAPLREIPDALQLRLGSDSQATYVEVGFIKPDDTLDTVRITLPAELESDVVPSSAKSESPAAIPASVRAVDSESQTITVLAPQGEFTRRVSITPQEAWVNADGTWLMVFGKDADGLTTHRLIDLRTSASLGE